MVAGSDWISRMDQDVVRAAALSPDYLSSVYGTAEWRVAWADDPWGLQRKLIPVRVRAQRTSPFSEASPLFPLLPEDWPRYRSGQFPNAERLHRSTLKLTVPHDDQDLADAYIRAFEKVLTNHRYLQKEPSP